jgi:hypothetical protein
MVNFTISKEVKMPNRSGRGFGRGGWGFGFRGSSPPWPYVGLGRGGLPRCGYFLSGAAGMSAPPGYPSYGSPWATPYGYAGAPIGADPYAPQMTREQELDFLKSKAKATKGELQQIDARIKELETD